MEWPVTFLEQSLSESSCLFFISFAFGSDNDFPVTFANLY